MMPLSLILQGTAQRFALPALGRGRRSRPTGKMIRRRKRLEIAAEFPASAARFVGLFMVESIQTLVSLLLRLFRK